LQSIIKLCWSFLFFLWVVFEFSSVVQWVVKVAIKIRYLHPLKIIFFFSLWPQPKVQKLKKAVMISLLVQGFSRMDWARNEPKGGFGLRVGKQKEVFLWREVPRNTPIGQGGYRGHCPNRDQHCQLCGGAIMSEADTAPPDS
jgi:hypothetical protein